MKIIYSQLDMNEFDAKIFYEARYIYLITSTIQTLGTEVCIQVTCTDLACNNNFAKYLNYQLLYRP